MLTQIHACVTNISPRIDSILKDDILYILQNLHFVLTLNIQFLQCYCNYQITVINFFQISFVDISLTIQHNTMQHYTIMQHNTNTILLLTYAAYYYE